MLAGGADNNLVAEMKRHFTTVKHAKPPASRKGSSEWYVVAQGFKGARTQPGTKPTPRSFARAAAIGRLQRVIADRAVHHPVADDEQGRAGRAELAGELEVALELGLDVGVVGGRRAAIPAAAAALASVSGPGGPAPTTHRGTG